MVEEENVDSLFENATHEEEGNPAEETQEETTETASEESNEETVDETEETTEEVEEEELPPLVVEVREKIGLEILDEEGKPKEYEDTTDGLIALISDVIETTRTTTLEEAKNDFLGNVKPVIKEFYNHVEAGNDPESFFTDPLNDIMNVIINEDDVDTAKKIISLRAKTLSGFDDEETKDLIAGLEASNKLIERSKKDLGILQQAKTDNDKAKAEIVKQNIAAQEKAAQEELELVTTTIKNGVINNIEIPLQERESFLKYITVPTKDGRTQAEIDMATGGINNFLRDAFLNYKKGDLKSIVQKEIGKAKVANLRDRVTRTSDKTHTSNNKQRKEAEFSDT